MLTHLKRGGLHFVLSTFLMLWFAASADAQISSIPDSQSQTGFGGINSIVGTVFGSSGLPVETRVRIRLSSMTAGDRTTTTNETGNFAFRGLPAGSFTISIDREKDFKPISQSVDIIQFRGSPAQTYTLNLRLEYKDQERAEPHRSDPDRGGR